MAKAPGPGGMAGSTDITSSPAYRALHTNIAKALGLGGQTVYGAGGTWNPHVDPVVAPGPPGTDLHRTQSGRYIDSSGSYVNFGAAHKGGSSGARMVKGVSGVQPSGIVANPAIAGTPIGEAIAGASVHQPSPAGPKQPASVKAMQAFLVSRGYNIPVDGVNGPLTKAAKRDFTDGNRNPKGFNQKYAVTPGGKRASIVDRPLAGKGGLLTPGGNMSPSYAASAADPPADPPINVSGLVQLAHNVGLAIPPSVLQQLSKMGTSAGTPLNENQILGGLNPNTSQMIPTSMAGDLAGLQYDAPIHDLGLELARSPVQGAQDLEDIKNWYDQVLGAQGTAAQRDTAASQAGVGSIGDAVKNIVSSLGGAANAGSGNVAAEGANQAGLLGALGTTQDQFNSDLAPILKAEAAGASARQVATNEKNTQDIRSQLIDQLGQKGQATKQALMDIIGQNNATRQQAFSNANDIAGLRSQIRQYNNGLSEDQFNNALAKLQAALGIHAANNATRQQNFQDKLSIEQAKEAAALTGARVITANASAVRAATSAARASQPKTHTPTPTELSTAAGDAVAAFKDPSGAISLKSAGGVQGVVQKVKDAYRAAGMDVTNPAVAQSAMAVLRRLGISPNPAWFRK